MLSLSFWVSAQSTLTEQANSIEADYDEVLLSNTDSALALGRKLLTLGLDSADNYLTARGYEFIGQAYYYHNDLDQALHYIHKSLEIYQKEDLPEFVGGAYMLLGSVHGDRGDYKKCLDYYELAETLFRQYDSYPVDRACLYYNIAHIFMDLQNLDYFESYIKRSSQVVEEHQIEYLKPAILNLRARLALGKQQFREAWSLAREALAGARTDHDKVEQVFAYENLGLVSLALHESSRAELLLDSAYQIALRYEDPYLIANAQAHLAGAYLRNNDLRKASALAGAAYKSSVEQGNLLLRQNASAVYAEILEKEGEYQQAMRVFREYTDAKDSLQGFRINEQLLRSQNRISEQQNELLAAEARLLKAEYSKGKVVLITVSLALVFCMVIIFQMVRNLRSRKEAAVALGLKQKMLDDKSRELEKRNRELTRINKGKDKLFSIISHDLKEPFNQVASFLQILEDNPFLDKTMKEVVNSIRESTRVTLFSMNNLLMWSKSQFMNLQTEFERVEVNHVLNKLITELQPGIDGKKLKLGVNVAPGTNLIVDPNHLGIILRNLLGNAIKFSPPGGVIEVAVGVKDGKVEIAVKDEGKGMSKEEVSMLFDPQRHFSTPGTLNEKGTGLGMIIVAEFLRENRGSIAVESEQNKGTTFRVWLPAA